jgi:branched-chain amino acid transport system substrate-binding protein
VLVWAKAAEKADSLDREAVADAIQGQSFTDTILGDVKFTDVGQMESPIYGFTVTGGKIEVLDEVPVPDEVWTQ